MNNSETSIKVGLARRFAAIIYDALLLFAVVFAASIPVMVPFNITYDHPLYFLYVFYIYGVGFLYFGGFWTHGGQTLAMKTWKIKVTDLEHNQISWKQAFIRYLVALVSWLVFGLGFLWALFSRDKKTWHDLASRTVLCRTDKS